jgi:HPr kinase/phosphorylase
MAKKFRPAAKSKKASRLPAEETLSGGLLRIFGVGTLIIGDSGIGKSESALGSSPAGTSSSRRRRSSIAGRRPAGRGARPDPNFMEIRGLGIINIREIFGARSIRRFSPLDLIIRLRKWEKGLELDRLGLKVPMDATVVGARVPQLLIPVAPGRNIATLIEVACKVYLLRQKGYHAPREIVRRLNRALSS